MSNAAFSGLLAAGVALLETTAGDTFTHNGKSYVGNFRTGNSLEQTDAGVTMGAHGFEAKTVSILFVSRAQFDAPPVSWKRQKILRETPTPAEYTIASINFEDPDVFAFVLVGRQ